MAHLIQDTALGQLIRIATGRKVLQYPEEKADFVVPESWNEALDGPATTTSAAAEKVIAVPDAAAATGAPLTTYNSQVIEGVPERPSTSSYDAEKRQKRTRGGKGDDVSPAGSPPDSSSDIEADAVEAIPDGDAPPAPATLVPTKTKDGDLVITWYSATDPSNPQNWSAMRKAMVTMMICLYTFVVYASSAIYTPSMEGIMRIYGVDVTVASLGLALYVLGYGTGPLVFSPLGEIASIGRNPVYVVTMVLFLIISIPTAFVGNVPGLLVLRFLQGFFGSPCLATGAATLGDMYEFLKLPYALIAWVSSAYCGPALGPLLAGYSVPAKSWRWSLYEIIWAAAPITVVMFALLPETLHDNILYRRARRLRANPALPPRERSRYRSASEKLSRAQTWSQVALDALIKPMEITAKDPAVLFVQVYTAIIYGIYYSFFEVFPLVYPVYYGMSPGSMGLVFLCILVSCLLGVGAYVAYLHWRLNPSIRRDGWPTQESRLVPALSAAFGPTVGLFVFAWTAREGVHWAVPTLGIVIYGATVFVVMQCIFVYVPLSYPRYAASLFAGNDFFRSALAFASILFAKPLFDNLGVAKGTSLLGGLSTIGIVGIWALWYFGKRLRSMSKFAVSDDIE